MNNSTLYKTPEQIAELSQDENFQAIANSYIETVDLYNKLYDDIRCTYGKGSRMFLIALNQILKDKQTIVELRQELESAGYSEQDIYLWQYDNLTTGTK